MFSISNCEKCKCRQCKFYGYGYCGYCKECKEEVKKCDSYIEKIGSQ